MDFTLTRRQENYLMAMIAVLILFFLSPLLYLGITMGDARQIISVACFAVLMLAADVLFIKALR